MVGRRALPPTLVVLLALGGAVSVAAAPCPAERWVGSWSASPSDAASVLDPRLRPFVHGPRQTLRMIITPHLGGSVVRLRLSNRFGSAPAAFSHVAIAHRQSGARLVPGTSSTVLFAGARSVTVPAGADAVSDPVAFTFGAFDDLAVSVYLTGIALPTEHFTGRQTSTPATRTGSPVVSWPRTATSPS